ncbi:MAG: peptidylprolyl isomerase [Kangiellaceae bacterium]|nr:peptidylprolyl isomerase [Kangiellaceae bacterium]
MKKTDKSIQRLAVTFIASTGLILSACSSLSTYNNVAHCIDPQLLYQAADQRLAVQADEQSFDQALFVEALDCDEPETIKVALTALGRIGGQWPAQLISTKLNHDNAGVRMQAAFAAGISLTSDFVPQLVERFAQEQNPSVQEQLALAIGNLGHQDSAQSLYKIINNAPNDLAARGAMQGLGILALFHRDKLVNKQELNVEQVLTYLQKPSTALQASFLLARVALINSSHVPQVVAVLDSLDNDSQAFALRALGNLKPTDQMHVFLNKASHSDIGIRVSAIQALGKMPIGNAHQVELVNQFALSDDVVTSITTLQSASKWMTLQTLGKLLHSPNSWVQAEAFNAANNPKPPSFIKTSKQWLNSADPNLQRAAINYWATSKDQAFLQGLAQSSHIIIANGAKQALKSYQVPQTKPILPPDVLPSLPQRVLLQTTQGDIEIELFADTPYTSANFINLVKSGFYNGSYFHRVIPNFVAQGGSLYGDGTGTVVHSIREELSLRSHRMATVGMATAGKDTGGGQFFFNLAPNLHLDSNYTIFAKVVKGLENALKLQQNDQILGVNVVK